MVFEHSTKHKQRPTGCRIINTPTILSKGLFVYYMCYVIIIIVIFYIAYIYCCYSVLETFIRLSHCSTELHSVILSKC